ncbi:MAG: T9SS type A sorting domain-containing protein, partial [Bacteroidetes bacterium]|nr:T9SS type A sorting domain-containing protein [Bacteroidota bacterium]
KASHGQIIFRVKPKAPLKTSDLVDNKAFIYFDYNPPVITNTALLNVRKVLDPGSAIKPINPYNPLKLYPNPTKDLLTILYTSNNDKCKIDVYDVMGHLVGQYELVNGRFDLDTRTLSAGVYLLVISSGDERVVARFGVEK